MVFGMNKLSRRSTSMRKGLAQEVYDPEDDKDYRDGDPKRWKVKTVRYKGMLVGQFKSEDVYGSSISEGIEKMKKQPAKYLAIKYTSSDLDRPEQEQNFTFIYRKNHFQLYPMDPEPNGGFTLVSMVYEGLPKFKDDVLPKSHRDKYTDSMVWKGKKIHTGKNKPLLPGRGMGIVDKPCLKVIGDVDPTDVKQGLIGDCWMLSGISTLAEYDGSIHRLFRKTQDIDQMPFDTKPNMYSITLFDLKTWKETDIVVDERLSLRPDWKNRGDEKKLLGARPSNDGQLWVPYLEKAITIHCGGYDQINYGANCCHAWAVLTGIKEQCVIMRKGDETTNWRCYAKFNSRDMAWEELDNDPWKGSQAVHLVPWPEAGGGSFADWMDYEECTDDLLFQKMCVWDDNNFLQAASSKGESDQNKTDGIIDSHAYGIVDCRSNIVDSGVDMIQLRNPWGFDGSLEKGMFVQKGAGWEKYPQIKQELKPELDDPGVFWLTKEEFFKYFGNFYLSGRDMSEFLGFPATTTKKRKAEEAPSESELPAKKRDDDEPGTGVISGADALMGTDDAAGTTSIGDAAGDSGVDIATGDNDATGTTSIGDAAGDSGVHIATGDNDATGTTSIGDTAGDSGVHNATGDNDATGTTSIGDAAGDSGIDIATGDNDVTGTTSISDAAGDSGADIGTGDNDAASTSGAGGAYATIGDSNAIGGGGGGGTGSNQQPTPYVVDPKVAAKERRRKLHQCVLAVFCLAALGAGLPFFIPFVLDLPTILGGDTTPIIQNNDTSAPTLAPIVATLSPTVSPAPTLTPTISPAPTITAKPTVVTPSPTMSPTSAPTNRPTSAPTTLAPTANPTTLSPTMFPTVSPTRLPTPGMPPPTLSPTEAPFTEYPTKTPTVAPTRNPTKSPTLAPTKNPTLSPTPVPTRTPTTSPTPAPTTPYPTNAPTVTASRTPTTTPTTSPPTKSPTIAPTKSPTKAPTSSPSVSPTTSPPTKSPTIAPTKNPTKAPTSSPSVSPTTSPPTKSPTGAPTKSPTKAPTRTPSASPTTSPPTKSPTGAPSKSPTRAPTVAPVTPAPTKGPLEVQLESISGEGAFDNPRSARSVARNVLLREGLGSQGQFNDRELERYVAAVLYFSTGGDDYWYQCFRGHTNCGSGQWFNGDVCTWQFITCDGAGFINSIIIGSDNGLRGSIPMEIWSLEFLEVIEIVDNPSMSGPLPTKFGETATNMVLMRVENSGLTGTIPNGFLTNSPLEYLYLQRNRLSGTIPNSLGLLTSLNELALHGNRLAGAVPPPVCTLRGTGPSDLQVLTVDCNEVSCSCCTTCY